jgi:hypothetical protein
MSLASGWSSADPVAITPQTRPLTTIGAPATDRMPACKTASAIAPETLDTSSSRAGRPVLRTVAEIVRSSSGQRVPARNGCERSLQAPITVAVPSDS